MLHYQANGKPKKVVYWLGRLVNEKAVVKLSHEHEHFDWFKVKDACTTVQYPDMQKTLKDADLFLSTK